MFFTEEKICSYITYQIFLTVTFTRIIYKGTHMIKYFIEDLDTQEWYRNVPFCEEPTIHTFGKGWNNPMPQRWTKDPLQALSFNTRKEGADILVNFTKMTVGANGFIGLHLYECVKEVDMINYRDIPKNLVITEHEFL